MKACRAGGGSECRGGPAGSPARSATARVRKQGADFSASLEELKDRVSRGCAEQSDWEDRVAAGIRAALDFAADNPAGARALVIQARQPDGPDLHSGVIRYFVDLLSDVAPAAGRFPVSTNRGVVESIATVVRGHLVAGTADRLPGSASDLVLLAVLPYLGLEQARRLADRVGSCN